MNSSSESEDFNYLEKRVTISWCGLPLNDILSPAGRIFWKKLWTAIWKLHDFMNNFYERFIPIHLYLLICYLFDECPYMRYLKDSDGFVYTQNMYHELSWFNCMDKFTKQMWRNQETNLLHPPFWLYFSLTKINKAMHSLLWWSMVWEMWIFFLCDLFHEEYKTQQRVEMTFFSLAHWLCNGSCVLLPEGFPKPLTIEGTFPLVCFYLPPLAIDGEKVFWK